MLCKDRKGATMRKRFTRAVAGFTAAALSVTGAVAAVTWGASTAAAAAEIVLENDFETDSYAPWQARGPVTLAVTDAEAHTGSGALSVTGRTGDWNGPATSVLELFEPGGVYAVEAWVKLPAGTAGTSNVHFTVQETSASGDNYAWVGSPVATTADGWVQIAGTYTMPEALTAAQLYVEAAPIAGAHPSFLVDDVAVTTEADAGPGPEPGVVVTTDFEDGTLSGWVPREGSETSDFALAVTDAQAHESTYSALLSGRDSEGDGLGYDVTGVLQAGVTYDISAWVRFADGQEAGDVWLSLANTTDGTTSFATLSQFTGLTDDGWTQVEATFTMPAHDSALLYFETAYEGGNLSDWLIDDIVIEVPETPVVEDLTGIRETVDFPMGVAIDSRETLGSASELLLRHFDQITAENHMKPEAWYDDEHNFRPHPEAIALMDYAAEHDLRVYGHVLVWHSQTPEWFFQDSAGNPLTDSEADQQVLRDRLRTHIFSIAEWMSDDYGQFGSETNPLVAFDVVNEVVSDGGEFSDGLRRSEWYRILGEDFIDLAFRYADEAFNTTHAAPGADRPVTLFINDYNTEQGGKQDRYLALVERLLARGVPLDGVGHQFHVSLAMPVSALAGAIERFEALPVTQAVTELDVTTGTPVTQAKLIEQGYYFRDAFRVFREHTDSLFGVTVWGLTDGRSWRSSSGAPLIFDDGFQAKPAYYGAVDGELPARLRTANVFAGDVPLDGDATSSLEWSKLPLHAVDEVADFQLRWAPDHLTAYVSVDDADAEPSDAVTFELDGATYVVGRDGSVTGDGATAVVEATDGGYDVVAHLPLDAAGEGDTLALDVRVTDGGSTAGWNTPGATGTLTLLEELSYLEVVEAPEAPVVDGTADAAYADADVVTTDKQVQGTGGAVATVRTLWRENTLYVLAEVADPVVDVSGSDPWIQDSVEIYVDPGNAKNGSFRYDDTQIRISAANAVSFGTGDEAFQRARVESATTLVDGGYVVEAAVSLLEYGGLGTFHGLDFQVNDASGGARTGIRNWADPSGAGYQSTARWGVGQLVGPAAPDGIVNVVAPQVVPDERRGTAPGAVLTVDPGQWTTPGGERVRFTYQWLRDGEPVRRTAGQATDLARALLLTVQVLRGQADPALLASVAGSTYLVTGADRGHEIAVEVTARARGLEPVTVTTVPVVATRR